MSEEKKNQEYYQETFREVHAPQGLAERLMNMEEVSKKKSSSVAKWVAVAAVAAVALFAGSNGVAYATTGSTWLETMIQRIQLDGVEYEVEMEGYQKNNGLMEYTGNIEHGNGDVTELKYEELGDGLYALGVHTIESAELSLIDNRIRLLDGDIEIDVTEELREKGVATGSYERNGYTKVYKITKEGHALHKYIVTVEGSLEDAWKEIEKMEELSKIPPFEVSADPTPTPAP